jgi:hypothetical protein
MAIAEPHFYQAVVYYAQLVLYTLALVIEVVAFLHCLIQRSEAFPAIGTLAKGFWLLLIAGSALFVLLGYSDVSPVLGMFSLLPIAVALVYLLDVRPALRDVVDGHGPW